MVRVSLTIIAVSDAVASSLRRSCLSSQKLLTIANDIDLEPFVAEQPGRRGNQEENKITIGVVGRLVPAKGHCYLLEAARDIISKFPSARFLFVGDGPLEQTLRKRVAALSLESHFIFVGKQTDMPAVYRSIDLLVLPSIIEGMPMVLIEAMAAQRPVVASRVGDIPKLAKHKETGLLVEAADPEALRDAIIQLLSDSVWAAQLAAKGQQWVSERFSGERMAHQYQGVYQEVLLKLNPHATFHRSIKEDQTARTTIFSDTN